jgi:formylglycine-generating enzyme required for sulfatase activity
LLKSSSQSTQHIMMNRLRASLKVVSPIPSVQTLEESLVKGAIESPTAATQDIEGLGSVASNLALALTAAEWERLRNSDDIGRLLRFAAYFPGYYSELAYERVAIVERKRQEQSNWLWAEEQRSPAAYLRFLAAWPNGQFTPLVQNRLSGMGLSPQGNRLAARSGNDGLQSFSIEQNLLTVTGMVGDKHLTVPVNQGLAFRDAPQAPELVAVAAGSFMMGGSDEHARQFEQPVRQVTIPRRLAVGRFPVTFEEWSHAVSAGVIAYQPSDEGWGRSRRPVVNVSWGDAKLYVEWLSRATGYAYRLLTESEWEYCCRAGTADAYSTGAEILPDQAQYSVTDWGSVGRTAEVGSFEPNRFGLYDMHGNVAEWVEDDWVSPYAEAGSDGSVVLLDKSVGKIARGGGWPDLVRSLRSASRNRLNPKTRNNSTGFRVARTLQPNALSPAC